MLSIKKWQRKDQVESTSSMNMRFMSNDFLLCFLESKNRSKFEVKHEEESEWDNYCVKARADNMNWCYFNIF